MLHRRDDDLVAGLEGIAAETVGDEVDGLGGAAHEDDLAFVGGVDELGDGLPHALEGFRRPLAQPVDAAVDVGVFRFVAVADRVDHGAGLLGAGGAVEEHQGPAVDPAR